MADISDNFLLYLPNSDSLVELDDNGEISQENETFNLVAEEKWMTEFLAKHNETSPAINEILAELRTAIKNEEIERIIVYHQRIKAAIEKLNKLKEEVKRKLDNKNHPEPIEDSNESENVIQRQSSKARNYARNAQFLSEQIRARENQKKRKRFNFF